MKLIAKIALALAAAYLLVIASSWLFSNWAYRLPSDKEALVFFRAHKSDLEALRRLERNRILVGQDLGGGAAGKEGVAPFDRQLYFLLGRELKTKLVRHDLDDGATEIYIWGFGCSVCNDSYKGFAWVPAGSRMLSYADIPRSLADKDMPRSIDEPKAFRGGIYLVPIAENWYIVRQESG